MSFLAPLWLLLGGAAAVPLLLHLMRRRTGVRVEFPAVRYLARAEKEHSSRLRLRNLLVMLLRVVAVLLVALAAARPLARWGAAGHAPTALAVVLDNSLSSTAVVDGRPALDALRAAARGAIAGAQPGDRVWLVTADVAVAGGTRESALAALAAAAPLAGRGDPPRALARAALLARGAGLTGRAVVIATDAQATSWPGVVDVGRDVTTVFATVPGRPPRNRAVVAAEAQPARWAPGGAVVARLLSADSAAWRLTLRTLPEGADRTLARGIAAPDGEVVVRSAPPERGWVAGVVSVDPDELRADDARHVVAWVGAPTAVVVDPSAGAFAASAVATLVAAARVTTGGAAAVSVVAAPSLRRLPALVVAPGDPALAGAANQALERAGIPWRFGALRAGEAPVRLPGDTARVPGRVVRRWQLVPRGSAPVDTLALAGGEPWAVAGEGYVVVASPLDPSGGDVPLRAAFVPWLGGVLARLAPGGGPVTASAPGGPVSAPPGADALLGPAGRRAVSGTDPLPAPVSPGAYLWLRSGAPVGALVVNPEAEESRLERLNARTLRGRVRAGEVEVTEDPRDVGALAFGGTGRRPIGAGLAAAALLVLLAEGIATRAGGLRRGNGAAAPLRRAA